MSDCLFCKIANKQIPANLVYEDADTLAFHDLNPQAPVHVLVIPKAHHADVAACVAADPTLAARVLATSCAVAVQLGVGSGFRLVTNNGVAAGQSVFHWHVHVLGGRPFTWPPG